MARLRSADDRLEVLRAAHRQGRGRVPGGRGSGCAAPATSSTNIVHPRLPLAAFLSHFQDINRLRLQSSPSVTIVLKLLFDNPTNL